MPLDAGATADAVADRRAARDAARREDDALVARYAAGDQEAARLLVARHAPRVLALARRMLGDQAEAEDVTQEAFLRLWRQAPDWRPGVASAGTWLHRVAANLCVDHLRRRRRLSGDDPPEIEDDTPSAAERMADADRSAALRGALDELPDRQRAAIVLRHYGEMANPEIAERLGVSVEAVESLLARGRRALARRLAPRRSQLGYET